MSWIVDKNIIRVYLAGPITLVSNEQAHDWRNRASVLLAQGDMLGVNPYRQGGESGLGPEINKPLIHRRDKFLIRQCHICLADLRADDGRGTLIELGMFSEVDKPVFGWGGPGIYSGNGVDPYEHPMIKDIVCAWDHDLDDLIDLILEFKP